ncbi:MAG: hypothetical protein GYA24_22470 [Candidatus Lokiarchaeota archaeon]|nr:hypothetical protein [Candidatus Lokiarchaeota archaeon]
MSAKCSRDGMEFVRAGTCVLARPTRRDEGYIPNKIKDSEHHARLVVEIQAIHDCLGLLNNGWSIMI